jgi:hypothetical protein
LLSLNGVHNLFCGAAEEPGEIQWLFVSQSKESFLDYARIPSRVTRAAAAKTEADMRSLVEAVAKKGKASSANVPVQAICRFDTAGFAFNGL